MKDEGVDLSEDIWVVPCGEECVTIVDNNNAHHVIGIPKDALLAALLEDAGARKVWSPETADGRGLVYEIVPSDWVGQCYVLPIPEGAQV